MPANKQSLADSWSQESTYRLVHGSFGRDQTEIFKYEDSGKVRSGNFGLRTDSKDHQLLILEDRQDLSLLGLRPILPAGPSTFDFQDRLVFQAEHHMYFVPSTLSPKERPFSGPDVNPWL